MEKYGKQKYIISKIYNSYISDYKVFNPPKISKYSFVHTDEFWAKFLAEDLYNKKYIFYLNTDLFECNNTYIKEVLYHEFTHLVDSIAYINYEFIDFKKKMYCYSEIHASEIEMYQILDTIKEKDISLDTLVLHIGEITIKSFMDQTLKMVTNSFDVMTKAQSTKQFDYDLRHLSYFLGFIRSLYKHGLNYDFNPFDINLELGISIFDLTQEIKKDELDIEKIAGFYDNMENSIKKTVLVNRILDN